GAKIGRELQFVLRLPEEVLSKATVTWKTPDGGTVIRATKDTLTAMWNIPGEKYVKAELSLNYGLLTCTKILSLTVKVTERGLGFFVDQNVSGGAGDGTSWADAYRTIEEALSTATQGDRIWVARGTYRPDAVKGSFTMTQDSVEIYGGFNATEEYLYERNPQMYPTVMEGDGRHPVVTAGNCAGIRIDGFTIENGGSEQGAGLLFTGGSTGTVANSIIRKNASTLRGGGIFATAPWYGYDGMSLINVEVSGNRSETGGGIYNDGGSVLLLNTTVSGNAATRAGGLYNEGVDTRILNTIIWGNVASQYADVENAGGNPSWGNSLIGGSNGSGANWEARLGADLGGNRDVNPLFLYGGVENGSTLREGNYHLSANSAAVNSGRNAYVQKGVFTPWNIWLSDPRESLLEGLPMDLDFRARIADDDMVDMGAYEYNSGALGLPILEREVIIPHVEGVVTYPVAGVHYVTSRDNFVFTATPSTRYAGEQLVVTTSRTNIPDSEGVSIVPNADGSYEVTIHAIQDRTDVYISFGWDPSSDSESVTGDRVWSYRNELHVVTRAEGRTLRVYSVSGQLLQQQTLATGETVLPLPQGVYAVSIDDSGMMQKVIIR
ncbi:MAG: T9SS type A sorting domain-containing protein, partial [Tannerella sp.]|nr:T9SS type A sorting domain-containing protein [Tannerella sp.]